MQWDTVIHPRSTIECRQPRAVRTPQRPPGCGSQRAALLAALRQGSLGLGTLVAALWYAPIAAALLLISAWARRNVFLWAVLPPAAAAMLEKIAFGTSHVIGLIKYRTLAPIEAMFSADNLKEEAVRSMDIAGNVAGLLVSPGMVIGLVAAAALLAAAIWVRRYRDESI